MHKYKRSSIFLSLFTLFVRFYEYTITTSRNLIWGIHQITHATGVFQTR